MKSIISTALLLAAGTALANAASLLVTFGTNSATGWTSETVSANGETWNKFSCSGQADGRDSHTWTNLTLADGSKNSEVSVWTQGSFSGGSFSGDSPFEGSTDALTDLFPSDACFGALHGGNNANQTQFSVSGLDIGSTYTLQVLVASAETWLNGDSVCSIVSGAKDISATVVAQNGNGSATFDDNNEITINVTGTGSSATNWAVLSYEFKATEGTVTFQSSSGGTTVADDIAGFRLTGSFVPEPSAFGLLAGIGALALVAARRRRSRKA